MTLKSRRTLPARQMTRKKNGFTLKTLRIHMTFNETKNLACSSDHQKGNGFTLKTLRIRMTLMRRRTLPALPMTRVSWKKENIFVVLKSRLNILSFK
jgi:hypothetical protein